MNDGPEKGMIRVNTLGPLWDTWSIRKKLFWYFVRAAGIQKRAVNGYNEKRKEFMDGVEEAIEDVHSEVPDGFVGNLGEWFKKTYYKWWYETDPKYIITMSVVVKPSVPCEYVMMTITVPKEEL